MKEALLNKLKVISDNNELQYHSSTKTQNVYVYTKSQTKKDQLIAFTKEELDKLISNNIIAQIK